MELWKPLARWEGIYEISSIGRIKRIDGNNCAKIGHIMGTNRVNGYAVVRLRYKGKTERNTVHTHVLESFIGPRPLGMQINHLNGVRDDNRLENLEYCTPTQNIQHSFDVLKRQRKGAVGEANGKSKLNPEDVVTIRRLYSEGGRSQQSIADVYGIAQNMVSKIVLRQFWSHIP